MKIKNKTKNVFSKKYILTSILEIGLVFFFGVTEIGLDSFFEFEMHWMHYWCYLTQIVNYTQIGT